MRRAPAVELSPEERARLHRLRERGGARRLRAEVVLLASAGLQDLEIGRRLKVNRQTAARWRQRFRVSRLRGLDEPSRAVRSARIPAEKVQSIVRATVARMAPDGRPWSTRRLARELGVSHMTVRRTWEAYGIRPARFVPYPARADPIPRRVAGDVIGVYLRGPQSALVVTLRSTGTESTDSIRTGRGPPEPRGGSARARAGPETRILPALRFLPNELPTGRPPDRAGDGLFQFVAEVAGRGGTTPTFRVLATGVSAALEAQLNRWRVRHPQLEFEFLPDVTAWRMRVRRELMSAGRGARPRRQFRGRAELGGSLVRSLVTFSEEGGAFDWMATRREIRLGEAAYRLRYDLAVTGHPGFIRRPPVSFPMTAALRPPAEERASARTVLRQYLRVRPKERVTIECWTGTLEYANAFVLETLRVGARPLLLYQDEPTYWAATTEVPAQSLASIGDHRRAALERTDVLVSFFGPSDRERFHSLPSSTMFRLGEYQDALYEAASKAGARTVQMAVGRVSDASARMYGVDAGVWRKELLDATLVAPAVLRRRGRSVAEKLRHGRSLEIRHPNGTRLTLGLAGREPNVADGTVLPAPARGNWSLVTLPAGVVSVALDESVAEGTFRSNVRCSTGLSDSVGEFAGGRWTFADGRLRQSTYDEGQELFAQSFDRARAGRDRPGSVSIGLNEHIATAPLLEDQGRGMVSLLIGRNNHLGGRTRTPWWAWLFLQGADLTVDGSPVVHDGKLLE